MKQFITGMIVAVALSGFSEKAEFKGRASILSIQELSREDQNGNAVEVLKITTTQSDVEMSGALRVAVELKDKNKKTYFGRTEAYTEYKLNPRGIAPTGTIEWTIIVNSSSMRRPKFTGYSVEFFYEGKGEPVLLDAEYEDCDSTEELVARNKGSVSIRLNQKVRPDYPQRPGGGNGGGPGGGGGGMGGGGL